MTGIQIVVAVLALGLLAVGVLSFIHARRLDSLDKRVQAIEKK